MGGLAGWGFILFEIFAGESAQASGANNVSEAVKKSFNNMRIIVSLGWSIYPLGYFLGQINHSEVAAGALNVTYNIADFVNKIAFVLTCWVQRLPQDLSISVFQNVFILSLSSTHQPEAD